MLGLPAAFHADGGQFHGLVRDGEIVTHAAFRSSKGEGLAAKILVQERKHHIDPGRRKSMHDSEQLKVEKLGLLHADQVDVAFQVFQDFGGSFDRNGFFAQVSATGIARQGMGNHAIGRITQVARGFEQLAFFARHAGPANASQEFLGFSRKHGAMDDRNNAARFDHCGKSGFVEFFRKFVSAFFCCAVPLGAAPYQPPVVRENVEYRLIGGLPARQVDRMHGIFLEEAARLFTLHEVPPPARFQVSLAGDAGGFARATGLAWFVAGTYDIRQDRFYFQNPGALNERGILRRTVAHEICHQVVARARAGRGASAAPVWLEESYCEAISSEDAAPACATGSRALNEFTRRLASTDDLRAAIENRTEQASAHRGLCLARLWGAHLNAEYGQRACFQRLIGPDEKKTAASFEEAFAAFRKKFQ